MEQISVKQILIDPERFLVMKEGSKIVLTKKEFYILYLIMSAKGKIQSRNAITRFAWGQDFLERPRTIDTHICNIRRKIGKVNERDVISVIKGVGYKLDDSLAE
ncbi:MAG: winged helix-turn-helix domain-containing protein [Bacteroidota bacterium]